MQQLDISSPMYTVAFNSLIVSVSWIEKLLRYIDATYKEYTESKFNPKKAWSVTTRLARKLLTTIDKPRSGIVRSLRTKKPRLMKQAILYSTIKSLDKMQKLAQGGLKNSPVVANELVKFLARNTKVEAIDKLQQQVSTLSAENKNYAVTSMVSKLEFRKPSKLATRATTITINKSTLSLHWKNVFKSWNDSHFRHHQSITMERMLYQYVQKYPLAPGSQKSVRRILYRLNHQ